MIKPITAFAPLATLALGGCVSITPPAWLVAPADPTVPVRDPVYSTVTAGVKDFRVVEPKDWREQNRGVGPADGAGDHGNDSTSRARRAR
ncbi:hypothetical protein [Methylobacterium isbiliense]|uniref:Lipoprotein n=1 Tax=Methylobacterium isbiliense TaxID=315478 RepID=A0ABQ4SIL1_9HYPH|nr:hypothetical protein [Methylobacterium isbiliense]MDN3626189.1 hypothetical protein [Methylobacterium isbiliense]GJE02962.1 hypothetical protein GMJLKIPL_4912 [Methylobacterium isbiliense]